MKISFELDGEHLQMDVDASMRAIDLLREHCSVPSIKEGCGTGECGACAVFVDGVTKLSCLMLAAQLDKKSITTATGLSANGLHPVQETLANLGGVQCGYCSPGIAVTAADFLSRNHNPDREQIRDALSGNLCRCTGYSKIVDAVEEAAKLMRKCGGAGK